MPAVISIRPTNNIFIDSVLAGRKWDVPSLTYSFPTLASYYGADYGSNEPKKGFEILNSNQQEAVRTALNLYESISNLSFVEIRETPPRHADLRFAESKVPNTAWAYYPSTLAEGGDAWFSSSPSYNDPRKGNYAYLTFLHESGHGLGLKHPHISEGGFGIMPRNSDSLEYSIMSNRSYAGARTVGYTNASWDYPQSLMIYDIAAIQQMYGADYDTRSGNTTYRWNAKSGEMSINGFGQGTPGGNKIFLTIWDGGGFDTFDFANYRTNLKISLEPGAWSITSRDQLAWLNHSGSQIAHGNIANALLHKNNAHSLIERAVGGSGDDSIRGNAGKNTLSGNRGADKLYGLTGNDVLNGGPGADYLNGGPGRDVFEFNIRPASRDIDTIADFSAADTIRLDASLFKGLGGRGWLSVDAFGVSASAQDLSDRIIYNSTTGALLYDVNGSGPSGYTKFAKLPSGLHLTHEDFFVF